MNANPLQLRAAHQREVDPSSSGRTVMTTSSITGDSIAAVAAATVVDVDAAVDAGANATDEWAATNPGQRRTTLEKAAQLALRTQPIYHRSDGLGDGRGHRAMRIQCPCRSWHAVRGSRADVLDGGRDHSIRCAGGDGPWPPPAGWMSPWASHHGMRRLFLEFVRWRCRWRMEMPLFSRRPSRLRAPRRRSPERCTMPACRRVRSI
jgi:hypothetical protein